MKFMYIIIPLFLLILSGCQNNKIDPISEKDNINSSGVVNLDNYELSNFTREINITKIDEIYPIKFTLSKKSIPLGGESVFIKVFNEKYGEIIDSFVSTDLNGKGKFKYLSPHILPEEGITIYIVYLINLDSEEDTSNQKYLEAPIKINFIK